MSAREFGEWMAYAKLAPFGERAWARRFGVLASTIYHMLSSKGAPEHDWAFFYPGPQIPDDDLPWGAEEFGITDTSNLPDVAPMRSEEYIKSRAMEIVKLMGGTITKKDGSPVEVS